MKNYIVEICLLFSLFSCSNAEKYSISGDYIFNNEYSAISLSLYMAGDSIIGNHAFIINNGNRIDVCTDIENTLHLFTVKNNIFEGTLISCYMDQELYDICIEQINEKTILFSFINNDHPFLQKKIKLKKEKIE